MSTAPHEISCIMSGHASEMVESTNNAKKMFHQRRRRKRTRPNQCDSTLVGKNSTNLVDRSLDIKDCRSEVNRSDFSQNSETVFAFLDKDGDNLVDGKPRFRSLSVLLEERRSGLWGARQKKWQSEMLFNFTQKPVETRIGRRQWRRYAHRKIPFTQLGSPPSEAVLAMDRNGDYLLSLGNMDHKTNTGLALRFYGIHSVASRKRRDQSSSTTLCNAAMRQAMKAPLLQSTPLRHGIEGLSEIGAHGDSVEQEEILNFHRDCSPSTTPIEILISRDWKVGVAMLYPSKNNGNEQINTQANDINLNADRTASIVLFTLPQRQQTIDGSSKRGAMKVFRLDKFPAFRSDHRRKLLWSVESIPKRRAQGDEDPSSETPCHLYFQAPGYLLFLDEGNGYRMTWVSEKSFLVPMCLKKASMETTDLGAGSSKSFQPQILSYGEESVWEEKFYESNLSTCLTARDDSPTMPMKPSPAQLSIVNESFLQLDYLLHEVITRRKGISESSPEFCYSMVSLNRAGRVLYLVIGFSRRKKACSLGVFLKVDLFTGWFAEEDWVKSTGRKDVSSLQKWCNKLAITRRMRELRAGPFAVQNTYSFDCSRLCSETFKFDNDEEDDYDESYWRDFVQAQGCDEPRKQRAPKLVTVASLYPCCDVITNRAIINFEPVPSIRAKDSPIQLVYN